MKHLYTYIGIGMFLLSLIGGAIYYIQKKNKQIKGLKSEIIEKAEIIKEGEGKFSKVVNNLAEYKQLNDSLSKENRDLIKGRKEKVFQIIKTVIEIPGKTDTVTLHDTILNGEVIQSSNFYYPSKADYFASVCVSFSGGIGVSEWSFKSLELDIFITEKGNGVFNAYLNGPNWIEVGQLSVDMLPVEPEFPDKPYSFFLGGGAGYLDGFKFITSGGVRYKEHLVQLHLAGFSGGFVTYVRPFWR